MLKSSDNGSKSTNRDRYLKSRTGDLTSYAALIGESFASRINLLAQILRDAHDPSLGQYKERLLMSLISEFIPRRYDVGTGFVLFPTERVFDVEVPDGYDELNKSDHIISHQCDIIVYDAINFPVIFKDEDFIVVRPESVRAIIEVKGTLDQKQIRSFMKQFIDFGRKWKQCNEFYVEKFDPPLEKPILLVMGWQIGVDADGRLKTDGKRLRDQIVRIYKREVNNDELKGLPILNSVYIYNDCEVTGVIGWDEDKEVVLKYGYSTFRGKFIRYENDGQPIEDGDKTIASLLARIHTALEVPFNRFFSHVDQTNREDIFPHQHHGFTLWLTGDDVDHI